jgi:hypothetical protein
MSDEKLCLHWHLVASDDGGQDTYAYSEAPEFNPAECPTVRIAHGHVVVCDECRSRLIREGSWPVGAVDGHE